jgi:tetratricopeptide (TPR) repeat protein
LLDFSRARQQATDLLTTDWMVVVDTDEVWHGVEEHLMDLVEEAEAGGFQAVFVPCRVGEGELLRLLVARRDSGHWVGPIHEYWELDDQEATALRTNLIWVEHLEHSEVEAGERSEHHLGIARAWLEEHEDARLIYLLARDVLAAGDAQECLDLLARYFPLAGERDAEERFDAHWTRAAAFRELRRYSDALQAAALALSVRPLGRGWLALAMAALELGDATGARALAELAIYGAERAMAAGREQGRFWAWKGTATWSPMALKAQALARLGRWREALAALEMAMALGAAGEELEGLRAVLLKKLDFTGRGGEEG